MPFDCSQYGFQPLDEYGQALDYATILYRQSTRDHGYNQLCKEYVAAFVHCRQCNGQLLRDEELYAEEKNEWGAWEAIDAANLQSDNIAMFQNSYARYLAKKFNLPSYILDEEVDEESVPEPEKGFNSESKKEDKYSDSSRKKVQYNNFLVAETKPTNSTNQVFAKHSNDVKSSFQRK